MTVTRSQITDAIFSRVENLSSFQTKAKRLVMFPRVAPPDRPAIFVTSPSEVWAGKPNLQTRTLEYTIFIYIDAKDGNGQRAIDGLMGDLEGAFKVAPADDINENLVTLGGLVQWCIISGRVVKIPGDIDGNGLVICPLMVMTVP